MNRMIPTALAALAVLGAASPARTEAAVGVRDRARMFSPQAVTKADQALQRVASEGPGRWQVVIETVDSLDGKSPREAALALAEREQVRGLSVVIARKEQKVWTEPSRSAEAVFTRAEQSRVTQALTRAFARKDFDAGLLDAVAEVRRVGLGVGVLDHARMFSAEAVARADEALESVRGKTRWGAVVETVDSLGGKSPREAATTRAKALQVHGLYVLISKADHKLYVEPSRSAEKVFTREKISAIDEALTSAFRAKRFDEGLLAAVEAIRGDAEANLVTASADRDPGADKTKARDEVAAVRPLAKAPEPAPAQKVGFAQLGPVELLVIGGGILFLLWLVAKLFRGQQAPPVQPGTGYGPPQGPGYPASGPPPQQPRPGPPGYGAPQPYGYGQAPAPGYGPGYGAPMPQQGGGGGGFMSGMLGGAAGAVVGNIIYDKFGHPHPAPEGQTHVQGGAVPPPGPPWPGSDPSAPAESYDPNAGVGADWGSAEPASGAPEGSSEVGGDWGAPEPAADLGGVGGDWGGAPDPGSGTGGDWGGGDPDTGGETGGDWGGGDAGSNEEQGGSW